MKKIFAVFLCLFALGCVLFFPKKQSDKKVVGVIVPMEHEALTQIVEGLKNELQKDPNVKVKVVNAQGDPNIQKALIQQLIQMKCDLFVPIGTTTSQMTLNLAGSRKVVCLAADPAILSSEKHMQATALDDNISAKDSLSFLHKAFPDIKKITLLYSSSEKVAKEIPVVLEEALFQGISVQKLMIQNMSELYTVGQSISKDSQGILILKDHLIVSGVPTLIKQAEKRKIPLMTSDEGSVISGGAFALGVKESSIGELGAFMAREILQGVSPKEITSQKVIDAPFLFINKTSCLKQGIDLPSFIREAEKMNITIEYTKDKEA